jgi:malate dehydrogenase (oxaloacetate-decarboxylating)(NADP+)
MYIINTNEGPLFLSDCTVNKEPTAEELVAITIQTVEEIKRFRVEPRVALLSYSNFGSVKGILANKLRKAVEILHRDYPDLIVDGEMQASTALNLELMKENFPFTKFKGKPANVLIFPSLASANIAHKLIKELTEYEVIGPILNGMKKPVQVLTMGSAVNDIVNMIMVSVMDAQKVKE